MSVLFSKLICWEKQKQWLKSLDVFTFFLSCKDKKSTSRPCSLLDEGHFLFHYKVWDVKGLPENVFLFFTQFELQRSLVSRRHWGDGVWPNFLLYKARASLCSADFAWSIMLESLKLTDPSMHDLEKLHLLFITCSKLTQTVHFSMEQNFPFSHLSTS